MESPPPPRVVDVDTTERFIRALALGAGVAAAAFFIGLGGGARTTTGPRYPVPGQHADLNDERQPPLLLCGADDISSSSSACHPWGATSTATASAWATARLPVPGFFLLCSCQFWSSCMF